MVHFVASDPFSIQFIIAVPVVLFCVWHFIRRSRLELRFKPQLTVVRQHVEGTLYKFAGMLVVSYAALATWSMLTSTGIIGTENSACLNGVNIRSVFVNATARVSSYFFFFAFALLLSYWVSWAASLHADPSSLDKRSKPAQLPFNLFLLVVVVWLGILQIALIVVAIYPKAFGLTCADVQSSTYTSVFSIQIACVLWFIALGMLVSGSLLVWRLSHDVFNLRDWRRRALILQSKSIPIMPPRLTAEHPYADIVKLERNRVSVVPSCSLPHCPVLPPLSSCCACPSNFVLPACLRSCRRYDTYRDKGVTITDKDAEWASSSDTDSDGLEGVVESTSNMAFRNENLGAKSAALDYQDQLALVSVIVPRLVRAKAAILIIMCVCIPMLLLKGILFAWTSFGGHLPGKASSVLYPWFYYGFPDIVAGVCVLYTTSPYEVGSLLPTNTAWACGDMFCGPCLRLWRERQWLARLKPPPLPQNKNRAVASYGSLGKDSVEWAHVDTECGWAILPPVPPPPLASTPPPSSPHWDDSPVPWTGVVSAFTRATDRTAFEL